MDPGGPRPFPGVHRDCLGVHEDDLEFSRKGTLICPITCTEAVRTSNSCAANARSVPKTHRARNGSSRISLLASLPTSGSFSGGFRGGIDGIPKFENSAWPIDAYGYVELTHATEARHSVDE